MNTIAIFLYIVSVIMWWAGFNYAATRTESPTRRKLLSTSAALALAWPAAFIALAGALATKLAANLMIAVGNCINRTWDAAVSDEGDTTTVTKLTPTCTAMRVRHENTEHDTNAANSSDEDGYTSAAVSEETSPALADNTLLMPPPPPPATDADDHDGLDQANTSGDETAQATANDTDMDDETVTIQKVTLSDLI